MRRLPLLLALALLPGLCPAQDDSADSADNSGGNAITAVTAIQDDGSRIVTISDPDKHTSESSTYNAASKLVEKVVYTLDDDNTPVSGIIYGPDNAAAFKAVYKHDDYKRIIEEDDYTLDDQLLRRFTYDFGPDGKVRAIHAFDSQGNEMQESQAHKDQRQSLPRVH